METVLAIFIPGFIGMIILILIAGGIKALVDRGSNYYSSSGYRPINHPTVNNTPLPAPSYPATTPQTNTLNPTHLAKLILYHGTPNIKNAIEILRYGCAFIIGPGNNFGTGLYLSDLSQAKSYANPNGVILVISLCCPNNQIADFYTVKGSPSFQQWVSQYGTGNFGGNISKYCIQVLKKRFLKVSDDLYVALAEKTSDNERVTFQGITVTGVLNSQGLQI